MANGWKKACVASGTLLLIAACSKPAGQDATLPVPALTLKFSSGRPLTPSRIAEIFPDFELTDPEVVPAPLIFGNGRVDALNLDEPVLLKRTGNVWTFVEMPSLNHTAWVYAGVSYERNELWAILDSTPGSAAAGLYLLRSTDHGETWTMFSGLKPPTLMSEFVGFSITARGTGRITVHQDDDTDATPRGMYAYQTDDGGKTWSGPTFTGDDLISADFPPHPTLAETLQDIDPKGTTPAAPRTGRGSGRGPAKP